MVNTRDAIRVGSRPSNDPRPNPRIDADPAGERESVNNNLGGNDQAQADAPVVFDAATVAAI